MISEEQKIVHDTRAVLDRAMDFEDYIMRRALGLFYIAWAVAFFLFSIFPVLQNYLDKFYWSFPILYLGIYIIVFFYTGYIFRKAFRASTVISSRLKNKKIRFMNIAFLIFFVVAITSLAIGGFYSNYVVLFAVSGVYVPGLILNVSKKTSRRIHKETWIAILSYIVAAAASIWSVLVLKDYSLLETIWILGAITWISCGIIGIYFADYQDLVIDNDE